MTLKWRINDEIRDNLIVPDRSLKDMIKESPRKYVIKKEKWCKICRLPETTIRNIKHISKYLDKGYVKIVLDTLIKNKIIHFTNSELLVLLGARDLSDGSLQRKALAILISLGYISAHKSEYQDKKGKTKVKIVYILHKVKNAPSCYDSIKDQHIDNWEEAEETKYFSK